MFPTFPRIPEVVDGMALSAATLNSYHRGLQNLLAQSHAPIMAWHAGGYSVENYAAYYTVWTGYAPLVGLTVHMEFIVGTSWSGKSWYVRLQYYGDDAAWHTVYEDDAAGADPGDDPTTRVSEDIDVSGEAQLTLGKVYTWRFQDHNNGDGTYSVRFQPQAVTMRSAISGWSAVPVFVDAATSDADDFNLLRTDIYALRDWCTGHNYLAPTVASITYADIGLWHTFQVSTIRWKAGQQLYVSAEFSGYLAYESVEDHHWFKWGVDAIHPDLTNEALYESGHIFRGDMTNNGDWTRFEETLTFAAAVADTYYQISFWVFINTAGDAISCRRAFANRDPETAPAVGWPTLTDWAHGETTVGETRLNAMSTALTALYVGGVEALFPEVPAQGGGTMVGTHSKPWLVYQVTGTPSPKIRYGADYAGEYNLPVGVVDTYQSFTLSAIDGLTPGSRYIVEGVVYAIEADEAYSA